jgi:hypothetical protein
VQQPIQLAAHRLQQLPPHRRGTGLDGQTGPWRGCHHWSQ